MGRSTNDLDKHISFIWSFSKLCIPNIIVSELEFNVPPTTTNGDGTSDYSLIRKTGESETDAVGAKITSFRRRCDVITSHRR